jgi:hypothetical protein
LNPISKDEWIWHFKDSRSTEQEEEPSISATTDENVDPIRAEELTEAIKYSRKIVRIKIVINNNIIEQVNSFNYLEYTITASNNTDLEIKMNRFNQMCSTMRRTLNNKTRKETQIKF